MMLSLDYLSLNFLFAEWRFRQRILRNISSVKKGSVDRSTDPFYVYYNLELFIARYLIHQFKEMLTIML